MGSSASSAGQTTHRRSVREDNRIRPEDEAVHRWYRFVLSFPPHLVREYTQRFGLDGRTRVLDPFCGTGTTLVECKKLGIPSVGVEANPMACFASQVKINWEVNPQGLLRHARVQAQRACRRLEEEGSPETGAQGLFGSAPPGKLLTLSPDQLRLLLKGSISPLPLHRTLVLLETLRESDNPAYAGHERLALAQAVVSTGSDLHFGPEVGVGQAKGDAPVVTAWLNGVRQMADDLEGLRDGRHTEAVVFLGDSRASLAQLEPSSVDAVITSPPYPNEKDYTRTTRLESVLLGFLRNRQDLMIRTGQLLADIARSVGYQLESIDLFRTRLPTATREQLREEVAVLRWPGRAKGART